MYNFGKFALELNEPEEGVAPTDSRNRPDQRLMEQGNWDEANKYKQKLEDKQRAARKHREATAENPNTRKSCCLRQSRALRPECASSSGTCAVAYNYCRLLFFHSYFQLLTR